MLKDGDIIPIEWIQRYVAYGASFVKNGNSEYILTLNDNTVWKFEDIWGTGQDGVLTKISEGEQSSTK